MTPDMITDNLARAQDTIARLTAERDEAQTDLAKVIMALPTGKGERAVGAVGGVKMLRSRLEAERDAAIARAEHAEKLLCRLFNASPVFNRDSLYQDMKEEILALRDKTAPAVTVQEAAICKAIDALRGMKNSPTGITVFASEALDALRAIAGGGDE